MILGNDVLLVKACEKCLDERRVNFAIMSKPPEEWDQSTLRQLRSDRRMEYKELIRLVRSMVGPGFFRKFLQNEEGFNTPIFLSIDVWDVKPSIGWLDAAFVSFTNIIHAFIDDIRVQYILQTVKSRNFTITSPMGMDIYDEQECEDANIDFKLPYDTVANLIGRPLDNNLGRWKLETLHPTKPEFKLFESLLNQEDVEVNPETIRVLKNIQEEFDRSSFFDITAGYRHFAAPEIFDAKGQSPNHFSDLLKQLMDRSVSE